MIELTDTQSRGEGSDRDKVYSYHDRTKHHLYKYADSLGYMDWGSQPDPFRVYEQAHVLTLDQPPVTDAPTYDSLFERLPAPPAVIDRCTVSCLFYESMAISAWKQAGSSRWSLRVNPSSGALHPTEAYLISGPIEGLTEIPAVFHYSPYAHALERRAELAHALWNNLTGKRKIPVLYIALTTIYWRESWKYGERAFRYCHHDVGHAVAAITFAAAMRGWHTRLVHQVGDELLTSLLGLHLQDGVEAEHPDCLLAVFPAGGDLAFSEPGLIALSSLLKQLAALEFEGRPNTLSHYHHDWPLIDSVAAACRVAADDPTGLTANIQTSAGGIYTNYADRLIPARRLIRQRRSAVAMDARTGISMETFYRMMNHVSAAPNNITDVLEWTPGISLALFVHRVNGLPAGLYLLIRDNPHEESLRRSLDANFLWRRPDGCPDTMNMYLLAEGDVRDAARTISCHQDIAADGAFSLGMLAEFDAALNRHGVSFYPRLFWETGMIGQILYLEAEAAGIRATGIGCFFDDAMHELLGIRDHTWQSLYHFTIGGALDDPRIQTLPSYWHLHK